MKNFLSSKRNASTISAIGIILTVLCAVSLYYLQFDHTAVNWIYTFTYLIIALSSAVVMIYLKNTNQCSKLLYSTGLIVINGVNFIGYLIYSITGTALFSIISALATGMFAVFALSYQDVLATGKSFNKCIYYNILVPVLCVIPGVLAFFIKSQTDLLSKIMYVEAIVIFAVALTLAIISVVKNKDTYFSWLNIFLSASFIAMNLLLVLSVQKMQSFLHGLACLIMAFMLSALLTESQISEKKKIHHKK